jgi:hypothetical protein
VHPIPEHVAVYAEMRKAYKACEAHALGKGPDPTPVVQAFARGAGKR